MRPYAVLAIMRSIAGLLWITGRIPEKSNGTNSVRTGQPSFQHSAISTPPSISNDDGSKARGRLRELTNTTLGCQAAAS